MDTLKEMRKKMKEMREHYLKTSKQMFLDSCKKLFEDFPKLESFSWTQYTPYWNDGDTCYFRANVYEPWINGVNYEYDEESSKSSTMKTLTRVGLRTTVK